MRSRLLLLIIIPTATALVLGAVRIASSAQSALTYQRVAQLATLSSDITVLAQRLEDERDQTVYFIGLGQAGGRAALGKTGTAAGTDAQAELQLIRSRYYTDTQKAAEKVTAELASVGSSFTPLTQQEAATARAQLAALPYLRQSATGTQLPALVVVQKYATLINGLTVLEDETAQGSSDPTLAQDVRVLGLVSRMKEEASEQRAILSAALLQQRLTPAGQQALTTAQSDQQANLSSFDLSATSAQRQLWNDSVSNSYVYQASQQELQATSLQASTGSLKSDQTTADDWYGSMSNEINYQMGSVEHRLVSDAISRAASLRSSALVTALAIGLAVLLVLALAVLFTVIVARSMVRPLRRLRAGALEVAGVRLPEAVRRMSETDGAEETPDIEPIDVDSSDEIGEVARAFDQIHREALRLASNEAALRGNVNAMFVNLSRRSQSLVERQIRLIDDLEQGEQDPERLGQMFQLDHLATRMRRNSENLLVLAGHEVTRRWTQSVALVDVLRAAVSEIEQYERVTLNVQPGIAVRGVAVNDVVHLIAELVENATSYSSADTPVNVAGHLLNSGGVLLDITDQGVGMGAEEMAHANWRLDNPPVVDVAVSRRMGLFVVARLAARHGIRVRLRPASMGGLTALVWLPDEVISRDAPAVPGSAGAGARAADAPAVSLAGRLDAGGLGAGGWSAGGPAGDRPGDDRSAAAQAVSAARAPRFAPLRPELGDTAAFSAITADFDEEGAGQGSLGGSGLGAGSGLDAQPGLSAGSRFGSGLGAGASSYDRGASSALEGSVGAPADAAPPSAAATGPLPVYGAPVDSEARRLARAGDGSGLPSRKDASRAQRGVVVPPALGAGEEHRLPIFESVESDWFRRGRHGADRTGQSVAVGWTSAADEGWRAAEAAHAPAAGGLTVSGLPRRVPRANLIPGSAASSAGAATPVRSAAQTRDRLSSFQRGMREGRAAARDTVSDSEGDDAHAE